MNVAQFVDQRRLRPTQDAGWLQGQFDCVGGGPLYTKPIFGHLGCVNALEFSNGGELLASGGDDSVVAIWRVDSILRKCKPTCVRMKGAHQSNIFALCFDASNRRVFSGGNDEQVILHDVETREALDVHMFTEPIYCIAAHPQNESIFGTAGEDGCACLFDQRSIGVSTILAEQRASMHSLAFNEAEPRLVATANKRFGLCLWDIRMPKRKLLRYGSAPTQAQECPSSRLSVANRQLSGGVFGHRHKQRAFKKDEHHSYMCVRFSSDGHQVLGLRRRLPLALFNLTSPRLVAEFDAPSYLNACTIKSCCFAGLGDRFIAAGSDDFGAYLWRIPSQSTEPHACADGADGPLLVNKPHAVLRGHRSIVNQVRFSASHQLVITSGVEKVLRAWAPFNMVGAVHSNGSFGADWEVPSATKTQRNAELQTAEWLRPLATHGEYIRMMNNLNEDGTCAEDSHMLAFFDMLLRRELDESAVDSSDELDELNSLSLSLSSSSLSLTTSPSHSLDSQDSNSESDQGDSASRRAEAGTEWSVSAARSASLRRYLRLNRQVIDASVDIPSDSDDNNDDTSIVHPLSSGEQSISSDGDSNAYARVFDPANPSSIPDSHSNDNSVSVDEYGSIDRVVLPLPETQQDEVDAEQTNSNSNPSRKRFLDDSDGPNRTKCARFGYDYAAASLTRSSESVADSVSSSNNRDHVELEADTQAQSLQPGASNSHEETDHDAPIIDSSSVSDSNSDSMASLGRWALFKVVHDAAIADAEADAAEAEAAEIETNNLASGRESRSESKLPSGANAAECDDQTESSDMSHVSETTAAHSFNTSSSSSGFSNDAPATSEPEAPRREIGTDSSDLFTGSSQERFDRIRSWTSLSNLNTARLISSLVESSQRVAYRDTAVDLISAAKRRWLAQHALLTTSRQVGNVRLRGESVFLAGDPLDRLSSPNRATETVSNEMEDADRVAGPCSSLDRSNRPSAASNASFTSEHQKENEQAEAGANGDGNGVIDLTDAAASDDASRSQRRGAALAQVRIAELKRLRMRLLNDPDQD